MDELDGLTREQLTQYQTELIAKRQEILDAAADARRVKPTLELGADGVPIQKGQSGEVMMDQAETQEGYTLDGVNEQLARVERKLQAVAMLSSVGPLWLHRGAFKRVKWYD